MTKVKVPLEAVCGELSRGLMGWQRMGESTFSVDNFNLTYIVSKSLVGVSAPPSRSPLFKLRVICEGFLIAEYEPARGPSSKDIQRVYDDAKRRAEDNERRKLQERPLDGTARRNELIEDFNARYGYGGS